jgi:gliding motility-associated-like protein
MRTFILCCFLFVSKLSLASHIIGGDIYYNYLGNNQYRFFITLYRDCNSTGAEYDNPLQLAIYLGGNSLYQNISVPFPGSTILPVIFNNPCATPPTNICVERAVYTTVVTLPPSPNGYTASYQRCCRGPNVTNLNNPDDTGITLSTTIPGSGSNYYQNSSPRFVNYPPILLCNNDNLVFNHVATDPDGDQLVYSLVTPNAGANSINPLPAQTPPPPYPPVNWAGGFSAATPLGPGSSVSINPVTGILNVNPSMLGLFVVGVRVQEIRNGVIIGETVRDFLFRVFNCNITMQAILPTQEQLPTFISYCQGLNVQFDNNSYGGTSYAWDFGVPGTNADVSSNFEPNYTYPAPGTYQAQLIVNPGLPCTDTAYISIIVNNPFSISWTAEDSLCIVGNQFNFVGISSSPNIGIYNWTFDANASQASSTGLAGPTINYTTPGFHVITLTGDNGECQTSFVDSVYIFGQASSSIIVPPNLSCLGYTIPFGNSSSNSILYQWDFGVPGINTDVSTAFSPTYTYTSPGNYTVQLIASSGLNCSDTSDIQITISEPLILNFTHSDSLCINGGLYDFDGIVSGPPSSNYWWNFGPNANPTNATTIDVNDVFYLNGGFHPVTLYGSYDNCIDSVVQQVYVYFEPTINFGFLNTLQCAPSTATFINTSTSDGSTLYTWDFGDGGTATSFDASHVYSQVGNYSVGLTLITLEGCIDTLYMLQQDLVTVHPSPIAGFSVNPTEVDVCDNTVYFTDESSGATTYLYSFDHNGFSSTLANFSHEYVVSGTDNPVQIVSNAFGCKDSAICTVKVSPFTLYIPNTFIPDEDGKNDIFKPITDFEIIEWEFCVYNRWGELVFKTDNKEMGWDGKYRGLICPDGIYAYVLKYKPCNIPSAWQLITGSVNLLK